MNNNFLYAKNMNLENILKLLFNTPEIEHNTKLNLLLQFNQVNHINNKTFDDYFFYNFNHLNRCISFNLSNDEQLALAFIYNKETQRFEIGISTNNDVEDRKEELFDRLSEELQKTKHYYLYKTQEYYISDCKRFEILQYLKNIAEIEYNNGFIFYPELINIQNLIIRTFESNYVKVNSSELFTEYQWIEFIF